MLHVRKTAVAKASRVVIILPRVMEEDPGIQSKGKAIDRKMEFHDLSFNPPFLVISEYWIGSENREVRRSSEIRIEYDSRAPYT